MCDTSIVYNFLGLHVEHMLDLFVKEAEITGRAFFFDRNLLKSQDSLFIFLYK